MPGGTQVKVTSCPPVLATLAQRGLGERRLVGAIGSKCAATDVESAALLGADLRLGDEIAFARVGALDQQRDARIDGRTVAARARDLLTDDRRHVAVERQHERLDLPAERIAGRAGRECRSR